MGLNYRLFRNGSAMLVMALVLSLLAGCYTTLEGPRPKSSGKAKPQNGPGLELPPDHRPIDEILAEQEIWQERSFLDEMVGPDEPLRFENLRRNKRIMLPAEHAEFTLRVLIGQTGYYDVWQIRVDEFGWVVGANWVQTEVGPEWDESIATKRQEFRIEPESEAALRALVIALLPLDGADAHERVEHLVKAPALQNLPDGFWDYTEPGLIEISYRVEEMGQAHADEWPQGQVTVPAEIIQVLIGVWEQAPPKELQDLIWRTVEREPLLIDLAIVIEAIVLAWQVEGEEADRIGLPLWVFGD